MELNKSLILERSILIDLVKMDRKDEVWRAMYEVFRQPFVSFFHKAFKLRVEQLIDLYVETFNKLYNEILENGANLFGQCTFFESLVILGYSKFRPGAFKDPAKFFPKEIIKNRGRYTSDILLLLLKREHSAAFNLISEKFKTPVYHTFCAEQKLFVEDEAQKDRLLEPFGEAVFILIGNIRNGKVVSPMTATLFTYFYRVYKNKVLEANKKQKVKLISLDDPESSSENLEETELPESFFEKIINRITALNRYKFENQWELVQALLNQLDENCRKLLNQFYIQDISLKIIAEQSGEKAGTVRKRKYDCLQNLRKKLEE